MNAPAPFALLAELTHRCPLACPYCSNPLELDRKADELATADWIRVFEQASDLGVLQLHLSGGEPATRQDLTELVAVAARHGLYSNLITSGIGLDRDRLAALAEAGLDHIQLSIQDTDNDNADRISGLRGSHGRKRAFASMVTAIGLPLTINAVLHRGNLARMGAMVDEAIGLAPHDLVQARQVFQGFEDDTVQEIVDRHRPIRLDSLGEVYLEPGWSRADRVAGDEGVLEVADDRLNVKRPGEDPSAFRPLAPGEEELGLARSGGQNPDAGKGEVPGSQGAGPDR